MRRHFWLLLFGWLLGWANAGYGRAVLTQPADTGTAHRMCWQAGHRLVWADFRAKTFPKSAPFTAARMGAISATGSSFAAVTQNGTHTYRVYAIFLRDSSWVNDQGIKTVEERTETLAHEQVHFDISELTARKLRQRIAQGLRAGEELYGPQASQAIRRLQAEENTLNDEFDREVKLAGGHRTEAPVRKRWQLRLAKELATLAVYQSTAADCP